MKSLKGWVLVKNKNIFNIILVNYNFLMMLFFLHKTFYLFFFINFINLVTKNVKIQNNNFLVTTSNFLADLLNQEIRQNFFQQIRNFFDDFRYFDVPILTSKVISIGNSLTKFSFIYC